MSDEISAHEVNALESALGALKPIAVLNRDQLMFRAGQESLRRRAWLWPTVAAASWLLLATLGTLVTLRSPAERVVYVQGDRPDAVPTVAPPRTPHPIARAEPTAYVKLRAQVLHEGVESLPPPSAVPPAPKGLRFSLSDL